MSGDKRREQETVVSDCGESAAKRGRKCFKVHCKEGAFIQVSIWSHVMFSLLYPLSHPSVPFLSHKGIE